MNEKVKNNGSGLTVTGYAAKYDTPTNLGAFNEQIAPGAFDNVLQNDVRFLVNHEGLTLARTSNGTLKLATDKVGLKYEAQLNDTTASRDVYEALKRGDVSQSSFAFTIEQQSWNADNTMRTVEKVGRLLDVSAVVFPAYEDASAEAT